MITVSPFSALVSHPISFPLFNGYSDAISSVYVGSIFVTRFLCVFAKLRKVSVNIVMSVCLSAWNNWAPTGRIFINLFANLSRQFNYITPRPVFKKRPDFCYKDFILQHFKHCPLQSSPLYWRYTFPNVSAIVGMLPGTHFLWWCAVLLSHFPESPRVRKKTGLLL
jgi:hypothetical protein